MDSQNSLDEFVEDLIYFFHKCLVELPVKPSKPLLSPTVSPLKIIFFFSLLALKTLFLSLVFCCFVTVSLSEVFCSFFNLPGLRIYNVWISFISSGKFWSIMSSNITLSYCLSPLLLELQLNMLDILSVSLCFEPSSYFSLLRIISSDLLYSSPVLFLAASDLWLKPSI